MLISEQYLFCNHESRKTEGTGGLSLLLLRIVKVGSASDEQRKCSRCDALAGPPLQCACVVATR